jgi:hypothetical protein
MAKITKRLFRFPMDAVDINESGKFAHKIRRFDGFGVELSEARPLRASTDVHVVLVFEPANEADLSRGRTRARVGTAAHPDADLFVAIAEPLQPIDEEGETPLGLRDGQTARWQGRASQRMTAEIETCFSVGIR